MDTTTTTTTTGSRLRADALLAYGCGHQCRVRAGDYCRGAELIAIGRQWARIRVAPGQDPLRPGSALSLEPVLLHGQDLPREITGRVAGRAGNELWLSFNQPLEVALLDLQSSLATCATA